MSISLPFGDSAKGNADLFQRVFGRAGTIKGADIDAIADPPDVMSAQTGILAAQFIALNGGSPEE